MSREVLIPNQDYEPLNVASLPRAFRLVLGGKARSSPKVNRFAVHHAVGLRHRWCAFDTACAVHDHAPS